MPKKLYTKYDRITPELRDEIWEYYTNTYETLKKIALKYNTSIRTVNEILTNKPKKL